MLSDKVTTPPLFLLDFSDFKQKLGDISSKYCKVTLYRHKVGSLIHLENCDTPSEKLYDDQWIFETEDLRDLTKAKVGV